MGLKFVCIGGIVEKGNSSLNLTSTCLWRPEFDGSILVNYEIGKYYCYVILFGASPK